MQPPEPPAQDRPRGDSTTANRAGPASTGPSTLLCESCGYPIDDFASEAAGSGEGGERGGNCPECGVAIAASLPARRTGSAWQNRRARAFRKTIYRIGLGLVGPWLATNYAALRRPREVFRTMRIDAGSGNGLLRLNLIIAAFLIVDPWVGVLIGDPARSARASGPVVGFLTKAGMLVLETGAVALLFALLTWIEYQGVRFFARQRGWRLTREGAWQVCCHASVGWILVGLLPLFGMSLMFAATYWLGWAPKGVIDLSSILGPMVPLIGVQGLVTGVLTIGGAVLGLMAFETLVYVGVRQCKFAATVGTGLGSGPGDPGEAQN